MDQTEDLTKRVAGLPKLSERQHQCVALVAQGQTSKEIGRALSLSPSTVDNHVRAAVERWGCVNRAEAGRLLKAQNRFVDAQARDDKSAVEQALVREERVPFEHQSPTQESVLHTLLSLPPLGGRINNLSLRRRYYHVVQIAFLSIMALAAAVVTIAGLVHLFSR